MADVLRFPRSPDLLQDDVFDLSKATAPVATRQERIDFIAASLDCASGAMKNGKLDVARRIAVTVIRMIDEIEDGSSA